MLAHLDMPEVFSLSEQQRPTFDSARGGVGTGTAGAARRLRRSSDAMFPCGDLRHAFGLGTQARKAGATTCSCAAAKPESPGIAFIGAAARPMANIWHRLCRDDSGGRKVRGSTHQQKNDLRFLLLVMVAAYVLLLAHGLGVLFFRGNGYRTNGNADKAIADCTEAIRLDPSDAKAYCGLWQGPTGANATTTRR